MRRDDPILIYRSAREALLATSCDADADYVAFDESAQEAAQSCRDAVVGLQLPDSLRDRQVAVLDACRAILGYDSEQGPHVTLAWETFARLDAAVELVDGPDRPSVTNKRRSPAHVEEDREVVLQAVVRLRDQQSTPPTVADVAVQANALHVQTGRGSPLHSGSDDSVRRRLLELLNAGQIQPGDVRGID